MEKKENNTVELNLDDMENVSGGTVLKNMWKCPKCETKIQTSLPNAKDLIEAHLKTHQTAAVKDKLFFA